MSNRKNKLFLTGVIVTSAICSVVLTAALVANCTYPRNKIKNPEEGTNKISDLETEKDKKDYTSDLVNKAKTLNYPSSQDSNAIKKLIAEITSTDENKKIDSKEKADLYSKKLDTISNKLTEINLLIEKIDSPYRDSNNKKLDNLSESDEIQNLIDEIINSQKSILDNIVDSLNYPSPTASAKSEIKDLYKNSKNIDDVINVKIMINSENGIASKIASLKEEINSLSPDKREELNNDLNSANTDIEFENLKNKINSLKQDYISELKKFAKSIPYEKGLESVAIKKILERIDSQKPEEIIDSYEKAENFLNEMKNIKSYVVSINYYLPEVKTNREALITKFNETYTFDKINEFYIEFEEVVKNDIKNEIKSIVDQIPYPSSNSAGKQETIEEINQINDLSRIISFRENLKNHFNSGMTYVSLFQKWVDEIKKLPEHSSKTFLLKNISDWKPDQGFRDVRQIIDFVWRDFKDKTISKIDSLNNLNTERKQFYSLQITNIINNENERSVEPVNSIYERAVQENNNSNN
ncbi:Uncharacterised protein [Mycoplasmopsis maculosa]|uniref:Lipoprotein n=1 Tax=Mycoplasmopsis maculosa TaxID=114885 RepID=A0A449B4Q5_9BACT|nr:hypothetical protein [Mycoplasmopsis maculosa]VEU75570.1 Uncharacterised protein [Mycoplasmopsis maculosa]